MTADHEFNCLICRVPDVSQDTLLVVTDTLCDIHRVGRALGMAESDPGLVQHKAVPLALARLNSRASHRDAKLALDALRISRQDTSALLSAELALAVLETEVVTDRLDMQTVLDARWQVQAALRRFDDRHPDQPVTRLLLELRAARLDARVAHQRKDFDLAVAHYEHARKLVPIDLATEG